MILTLRTDDSVSSLSLIENGRVVAEKSWEAGRQLSSELLPAIEALVNSLGKTLNDCTGIICFKGPGSYTGLRIGTSAANSLGYSLSIPVVATKGDGWVQEGMHLLENTRQFVPISPFYGGNVRVTEPKK